MRIPRKAKRQNRLKFSCKTCEKLKLGCLKARNLVPPSVDKLESLERQVVFVRTLN